MSGARYSHLLGRDREPRYVDTAKMLQTKVDDMRADDAIEERKRVQAELDAARAELATARGQVASLQGELATERSARAVADARNILLAQSLDVERGARATSDARIIALLEAPIEAPKLTPYRIEIPQATGGKRTVRLIPEQG